MKTSMITFAVAGFLSAVAAVPFEGRVPVSDVNDLSHPLARRQGICLTAGSSGCGDGTPCCEGFGAIRRSCIDNFCRFDPFTVDTEATSSTQP